MITVSSDVAFRNTFFQEKELILKQVSNLLYKKMVMVSRFDYNQSLRVNEIYVLCIDVYRKYHKKDITKCHVNYPNTDLIFLYFFQN